MIVRSESCSVSPALDIGAWSQNHQTFCSKESTGSQETCREEKTQINRQRLEKNSNMKLPGTHYPPVLLYSFHNCNLPGALRSTRCLILRDMAKVRKAETWPPLNKTHKLKRQEWAKKYLKTDFSKVLWTDESDSWRTRWMACGWISNGHRAPLRLRRQQDGGGVPVWAGIIKDELVGPFRVENGLKINSQTYCQFLEDTFFTQWYKKKSASFKKTLIFMQDNAPSHASKYSTVWLASKGLKKKHGPLPHLT